MNSPVWNDSPVTEVIINILEALFPRRVVGKQPKDEKDFLVLSYREDFPKLWNLNGRDRKSIVAWALNGATGTHRTLVIVWDGMPSQTGRINVADFVLPFDWAFALSATVLRECPANEKGDRDFPPTLELPRLRILIVDLESEKHGDAFSFNSLPVFGHAMPWIQIYKPIQSNRMELAALFSDSNDHYTVSLLRSAITAGSLGVGTLLQDVMNPDRLLSLRQAFSERNRSKDIEALTNLYKSSMLSAKTRHDVGNLLAPLLLVETLPENQRRSVKKAMMAKYPLRTALMNLAAVLGLAGNASSTETIASKTGLINGNDADIFERHTNLRFLLVDDQFSLGYQHLLASFIFGESYDPDLGVGNSEQWRVVLQGVGELSCVSSAEDILSILEGLDPIEDWEMPRFLDVPCDVLILDLRLWTTAPDRGEFFDRIFDLCAKLGAQNVVDYKFKRTLRRAAVNGDGEQSEIEALALFPLLLSHLDPSLPIILFSSTHQRAVMELVSHRANIITDFAKPILSGYGEERSAVSVVDDLGQALWKAIQLHEARGVWPRIRTAEWKITPIFECQIPKQKGRRVRGVFNAPASANVTGGMVNAGAVAPRIDGTELRKLLAGQFIHYIQRSNSFDFGSIPWELLEGNLIPEEVLDDPKITNPDFGLSARLISPPEFRNFVPRALEIIRHKKAHGQIRVSDQRDLKAIRLSAILQLHLLLDFIEGAQSKATVLQPAADTLWNYIRVRHKNFRRNLASPQPTRLTANNKVPWLDFIAYTFLWAAEQATDGFVRYVRVDTLNAIQRLAKSLLDPFWAHVDIFINTQQPLTGIVQNDLGTDYLVEVSEGFWGLLPKTPIRSQLKTRDQCTVVIINRPPISGGEIIFN